MFKGSSVLKADSIIDTVAFDSLYSKCRTYLLNLRMSRETGSAELRSPTGKSKGAVKQSRTVRKK